VKRNTLSIHPCHLEHFDVDMPSGEHVCGSLDPYFRDNTLEVVRRYKELGGKIEVIVKKGEGHYPLAPENPGPVVDFITRAAS